MRKRVTITDLAKAAGVSAATVDRVLNGRSTVRQATAMHVLDVAREMGFHAAPLLEKRLIGEKESLTIGLVLLPTEPDFYRQFQAEAEAAALAQSGLRLRIVTEYAANSSPAASIAALERLAPKVQAIGLVAVDHPRVTEAVADLKAKGIPVIALLSDLAQGVRHACLGVNNLKVGRVAAAMLARGVPKGAGGALALFVGGQLWHGHELRETGFRSYIRRERPDLVLLDTQINLDTDDLTYEAAIALMARHKSLCGIYCCGGGRNGVIRAVREERRHGEIDVIANELTETTRRAMAEGIVSLVIDTPLREICASLVTLARQAVRGEAVAEGQGQVFLPMRLILPESI